MVRRKPTLGDIVRAPIDLALVKDRQSREIRLQHIGEACCCDRDLRAGSIPNLSYFFTMVRVIEDGYSLE